MIALRKDGVLNFLIGDHLGSTSLTTDADGVVISEMLYTACPLATLGMLREGEVRHESGVTATNHTYTGQYSNVSDFGLMHYRARWMDPQLGRFTQPDMIIPSNQGVQAWDRFAYVNNNPVRYNDPTGHCIGPVAVYCGAKLVFSALVVVGITALIYSTPQMQELGQQAKAGIENAVQMAKSGEPSTKHRKNENNLATIGSTYNYPENPPPTSKCQGTAGKVFCFLVEPLVIAGVIWVAGKTGGCNEPESNCSYHPNPTDTPTTPTPPIYGDGLIGPPPPPTYGDGLIGPPPPPTNTPTIPTTPPPPIYIPNNHQHIPI
jgi:RHS repeat-associated protein